MRKEQVIYNGVIFTRYPDSERRQHRVYFWPSKANRERGVGALHVEVWKSERGSIPPGYQVHHVNHDPSDNRIENLACIPADEHQRQHPQRGRQDEAHLARMRELAKEWHGSDEGLAWHREQGRRSWEGRTQQPVGSCTGCGQPLESKVAKYGEHDRWHRKCYLRAADNDKRYWHDATCQICGTSFKQRTSGKPATCSKSCGARLRHQRDGQVELNASRKYQHERPGSRADPPTAQAARRPSPR